MANIDDSGDVFPDVYQLATTDPGVGGPPNDATNDGTLNRPIRHLAQRTAWLKSRVDTLLAAVGTLASTAVAGIVQLSDSVTSTATNLAATANAVKKANDNANSRVPQTRTVTGGGLATGGGSLDSNRTITVTAASNVDAIAGTRADVAMTPAATKDALDNRFGSLALASLTATGLTQLSDSVNSTATDRAATPSAVKQANDNANARAPSTRVISGGGLVTGGGDLSANRTLTVSPASGADALAGTSVDLAMTPAATKTVLDSRLASYAPGARTVSAAGLATGGGDLTANRTITVTKATASEAITGTRDDVALTPLAAKAALDDRVAALPVLGVGQSWVDVTASRTWGVTYTNATGRPIMVSIQGHFYTNPSMSAEVSADGTTWVTLAFLDSTEFSRVEHTFLSFVVPPGHKYRVTGASRWAELR